MNLARLLWALGALIMVIAAIACLMPREQVPAGFEFNDKLTHLAAHGTLAVYFAGLMPRNRWWKIFALLLLFGVCIEFAQHFMQLGRHGDVRDVLANSLGAALGLLLARLGLSRWPELAGWVAGRRSEAG